MKEKQKKYVYLVENCIILGNILTVFMKLFSYLQQLIIPEKKKQNSAKRWKTCSLILNVA